MQPDSIQGSDRYRLRPDVPIIFCSPDSPTDIRFPSIKPETRAGNQTQLFAFCLPSTEPGYTPQDLYGQYNLGPSAGYQYFLPAFTLAIHEGTRIKSGNVTLVNLSGKNIIFQRESNKPWENLNSRDPVILEGDLSNFKINCGGWFIERPSLGSNTHNQARLLGMTVTPPKRFP